MFELFLRISVGRTPETILISVTETTISVFENPKYIDSHLILLEYCTPVWTLHNIGNINKVEDVQRRFTKSMNGLSSLSYISRLYELSLETLESRPFNVFQNN